MIIFIGRKKNLQDVIDFVVVLGKNVAPVSDFLSNVDNILVLIFPLPAKSTKFDS